MATNETELALLIVDANMHFNMKILLLIILSVYAVGFLLYGKKLDNGSYWSMLVVKSMTIFSWIIIPAIPLSMIFFYREVSIGTVLGYLYAAYGIAVIIAGLIFRVWMYEFFKNLLAKAGFNIGLKRNKKMKF